MFRATSREHGGNTSPGTRVHAPSLLLAVRGIFVPAKTPDSVVQTLSAALAKALQDPTLARRFIDISTVPTPEKATPHALAQTLKGDIGRWRPLIQAAGQFAD